MSHQTITLSFGEYAYRNDIIQTYVSSAFFEHATLFYLLGEPASPEEDISSPLSSHHSAPDDYDVCKKDIVVPRQPKDIVKRHQLFQRMNQNKESITLPDSLQSDLEMYDSQFPLNQDIDVKPRSIIQFVKNCFSKEGRIYNKEARTLPYHSRHRQSVATRPSDLFPGI